MKFQMPEFFWHTNIFVYTILISCNLFSISTFLIETVGGNDGFWSGWLDSELRLDDGILLNGLLVSTTSSSNFLRLIDLDELLRRTSAAEADEEDGVAVVLGILLNWNKFESSGLFPVWLLSDMSLLKF